MAEEADPAGSTEQQSTMANQDQNGDAVENSADTPDSDDYDPSATLQQDFSIPTEILQTSPSSAQPVSSIPQDASVSSTLLSPSSHHPSTVAGEAQDSSLVTHLGLPSQTPVQSQPRLKGGFVLEEEDEVRNDEAEAGNPLYDAVESMEGSAPTAGPLSVNSVDSTAFPPNSIQGDVQVPHASSNVSNSASNLVPFPAVVQNGDGPSRDSTATPAQHAPKLQVNSVQSHADHGTPPSSVPKARLAHDIIGIMEDRITEDPRGDLDAWLSLLSELRSRNRKEDVRRVYGRFFKHFPLAAEQWTSYATWENENNHLYELEQIFAASLLQVPDVQLWHIYLSYIRRRNSMTTGDTAKSYKIISESFNFALDVVGMDKDSGPIWQEYINFIKTSPGIVGGTGWQDTQKMDALRAAYQKAIAIPTSALAPLWKEYDGFETGISKINGRKFLQEKSPAYMTARTCYTQLQNLTRDLNRTTLPKLPPVPGSDGEAEYIGQVHLWKEWIAWEKADNLVLKDDDPKAFRKRVLFTYTQALMALQFWPPIWYDAAEFCFEDGMEKEGLDFLRRGIVANPESCLLAFKLSDRIELTTTNDEGNDPGAKLRMSKVRDPYDKLLNSLYELGARIKNTESLEMAKLTEQSITGVDAALKGLETAEDNEASRLERDSGQTEKEARIAAVKQNAAAQTALLQKTISYAWIGLIRAARRIQGKGLPGEKGGGFRAVFGDARKRGKITSDVYVENALIEYHCYKDPVGTKIFERGMKLFPDDERFALEYLKHLIAINDTTNARAVFETTVGKLTANPATAYRAKPIFTFLHEHESHFGELSHIARLEKRMKDLYPEDAGGHRQFSERYISRNFDPTQVRLAVSATQVSRPEIPDVLAEEQASSRGSPQQRILDNASANSPKRALPIDELDDNQPRKFARGESPLKGAAGRRMHQPQRTGGGSGSYGSTQLSQTQQPPLNPLPSHLTLLLSMIPKASTYEFRRFDAAKMTELLRNVHIPSSAQTRQGIPSSQGQSWSQQYSTPPQQAALAPPGMPSAGPSIGPPPYSGNFRS